MKQQILNLGPKLNDRLISCFSATVFLCPSHLRLQPVRSKNESTGRCSHLQQIWPINVSLNLLFLLTSHTRGHAATMSYYQGERLQRGLLLTWPPPSCDPQPGIRFNSELSKILIWSLINCRVSRSKSSVWTWSRPGHLWLFRSDLIQYFRCKCIYVTANFKPRVTVMSLASGRSRDSAQPDTN